MDTAKTQVAYKKGDVYLCELYCTGEYKEVEILDVAQTAQSVKTDLNGWIAAAKFHPTVRGKIGHVEYHGWWVMKRRILVRDL